MKVYKGQSLESWSTISVSYKIDGVQGILNNGRWLSRAGKPLHNLPLDVLEGRYEVYLGNWNDSVSYVRTLKGNPVLGKRALYRLDELDDRLKIPGYQNRNSVTHEEIEDLLKTVLQEGYEGLIISCSGGKGSAEFKVKPVLTYDVTIVDVIEGNGRNVGRLGALVTLSGKVGTGFTDKQREDLWESREKLLGATVEVQCMELTSNNQFRHPRFIRIREDK